MSNSKGAIMSNANLCNAGAILLVASIMSSGVAAPNDAARAAPRARYQVDAERNRVWLLTRDGVLLYDAAAGRFAPGLPDWQWLDAPYGCLPDLALGPGGEAVVTSNVLPTLWRVDPETLAVTVHPLSLDADADKDVGFSALVYSPEQGAYFAVSGLQGSLWRIDPRLGTARKIPLSAPVPAACGVTMPRQAIARTTSRPPRLCVRGPRGGWTIDLAPDQRSAYVRAGACAEPRR
jgi:hypothetical protein